MATPIEDYALIGDTQTAALVSKGGSIDWMCLPRFDGGACFAALLGDESNGCWQIAPVGGLRRVTRRYRDETLHLPEREERPAGDRPVPAKVLPPPPSQADLEEPPRYPSPPPRPERD